MRDLPARDAAITACNSDSGEEVFRSAILLSLPTSAHASSPSYPSDSQPRCLILSIRAQIPSTSKMNVSGGVGPNVGDPVHSRSAAVELLLSRRQQQHPGGGGGQAKVTSQRGGGRFLLLGFLFVCSFQPARGKKTGVPVAPRNTHTHTLHFPEKYHQAPLISCSFFLNPKTYTSYPLFTFSLHLNPITF